MVTLVWQIAPLEAGFISVDGPLGSKMADSLHVLLAEDHPTNRAVIEAILSLFQVELTSVENGLEAVEAFSSESYDVVLMDLQMPVMDGLTAIREIRKIESQTGQARTPILAVTANAMASHVTASLDAGADRHISKPIAPDDLIGAISGATGRLELNLS
jgi:CheY-like chemotaxis protein